MNSHDMLEQKIMTALSQAVMETYGFTSAALVRDIAHRVCAEVERYREGQKAVFAAKAGVDLHPRLARAAITALDQPPVRDRDRALFEDHYPLPLGVSDVAS